METIRFDKADVFTWESTHDEWIQEAMDDSSDIAIVIGETIRAYVNDTLTLKPLEANEPSPDISHYTGDVHGAQGPVGLYIYTMEDDEWIYVAHYINEVEHQCFLFRHRKQIVTREQWENSYTCG